MRKPRIVTKGKNVKRKQESADGEPTKRNAKAKKITNSHSNSNSNDSNSTEIKRRKFEKPVEKPTEIKVEEVDTSKDDVTIFLSNLEYR